MNNLYTKIIEHINKKEHDQFINLIPILILQEDINKMFSYLCTLDKAAWLELAHPRFSKKVNDNVLKNIFYKILKTNMEIESFRKIAIILESINIKENLLSVLLQKMFVYFNKTRKSWDENTPKIFKSSTTIYTLSNIIQKLKKIDFCKAKFTLENIAYLYSYETGKNPTKIIKELYKTNGFSLYY